MSTIRLTADLHVHSRFALATSPGLTIPALAETAARKGIDLLATGDFTHPAWLGELRRDLTEHSPGVYGSRTGMRFVLGTELSCVWQQDGRGRRVHVLLLAPGFHAVDRINTELSKIARLESDGRPVLKLSAADLARLVWEADDRCVLIPAHIWTPWYGLYGSKSGFDSIAECFGELADRIRAVETGLSSDPEMCWRMSDLDGRAIVSFSDAHSPPALGRELTVLEAEPTYDGIAGAIEGGGLVETIEFYPEHGKYHLNGHRKCGVRLAPDETPPDGRCPACGRPLTLGVLHRIEELSDRIAPAVPIRHRDGRITGPPDRPPFRRLTQLRDLLAEAFGVGRSTKTVERHYDSLVDEHGTELNVLLEAGEDLIARSAGEPAARAVIASRLGDVQVEPGYDGVYGNVRPVAPAPR